MFEKLQEMENRFKELEKTIADPELVKDQKRFREAMQEHAHLSELMEVYDRYKQVDQEIEDANFFQKKKKIRN